LTDDDIEVVRCPSCGAWLEDFDGFGFIACEKCGFCRHPNAELIDGKWICGICGKEVHNG
jgi:DNA-directed RNA polymerase subunit RPC12/RpoP